MERSGIRAVITTGTPHDGAPLARTLNPSAGTNRIVNAFSGAASGVFSACAFAPCSTTNAAFVALRDGLLGARFSSPGMRDLKPGSPAMDEVNGPNEGFPNYGIQHAIPRRWAIAQVGGDALSLNQGDRVRSIVRDAFSIAVSASVIGGILSIFQPWAAPYAIVAGVVAHTLDSTDRWWTRITVGRDEGDGVVPYDSQVYPGALRNYRAPEPVSHTGEIDTRTSSLSTRDILIENVGLAPRNT